MKPSQRIRKIFNEQAKKYGRDYEFLRSSNVEQAIIDYLDEEYEKQQAINNAPAKEERKKFTLRIDSWSSTCLNCNKGADPDEVKHKTVLGYGVKDGEIGCGVQWEYKVSGYTNILKMRPDLKQVDFFTYEDMVTPKVATSEKECNCSATERQVCDICQKVTTATTLDVTPSESEDWKKRLWQEWCDFERNSTLDDSYDWWMGKIKDRESKAYQRGRDEEKLKWTKMYGKCIDTYEDILKQTKSDILSLAVQEIKKMWNYPCDCARKQSECIHDYNLMWSIVGMLQGLDKAKSIISGLMKK